MALTAVERMVLSAARKRIARNKNYYVCNALIGAVHDLAKQNIDAYVSSRRLRDYIINQLGGTGTLENWCRANGWPNLAETEYGMRKIRVQWINWMLGDAS